MCKYIPRHQTHDSQKAGTPEQEASLQHVYTWKVEMMKFIYSPCPNETRQFLPSQTHKINFIYFRITTTLLISDIHKHFNLNLVDFQSKDKLVNVLNHSYSSIEIGNET